MSQQFGWQGLGRDTFPPLLCDLSTAEVDVMLRRIVRGHVSHGGPTAILALGAGDQTIGSWRTQSRRENHRTGRGDGRLMGH